MIIEDIARVTHQVNKAYCESIGDFSQPEWHDAPKWQRDSAINGVKFHLKNPNATPKDSHKSWLAEKFKDGWKFGPVKDPEKKEHPCYRPYEELPQEQRSKDYLFKEVVESCRPFLMEQY